MTFSCRAGPGYIHFTAEGKQGCLICKDHKGALMSKGYAVEQRSKKRRKDDELLHKALNDLIEVVRKESDITHDDSSAVRLEAALERFANRRNG